MERNIIVYEKISGELYKLKEVAGEAILCCPKENLSRLKLTRQNGNYDIIKACKDGESEFVYLCDAGGRLPAQTLFFLLIYSTNNQVCGWIPDNIKDTVEFLVANHVEFMPWRNREISLKLVQDKEKGTWGIVDNQDLGIFMDSFENLSDMIDAFACILRAMKDQCVVDNVKFVCETHQTYAFLAEVMGEVDFTPNELELIEK